MRKAQNNTYTPFFEILAERLFPGPVGKILMAILLALSFLLPRYIFISSSFLGDYSWLLALIIIVATLSLYYASYNLHGMLAEMRSRSAPSAERQYMTILRATLSTRKLLVAGVILGCINIFMGRVFGVPGEEFWSRLVIYWGFFVAGTICGMAVYCIYGVIIMVSSLAEEAKKTFDFTAPDKCGGTHFIGDALLVFAMVTLISGVLISLYIMKAPWTAKPTDLILFLKSFWILFPYFMSLCILLLPAISLNRALQDYQVQKGAELKEISVKIRDKLQSESTIEIDEVKSLREDYSFQENLRSQLFNMGTWPFNLNMNLRYLTVFVANGAASFSSASEWVNTHFPDVF